MFTLNNRLNLVAFVLLLAVCVLGCKSDGFSVPQQQDLLAKGKKITSATFKALSAQLQAAMVEGGVPHAVKYCNMQALPITDSLSLVHDVVIRRTSDKVRNPKNKATYEELKAIKVYKAQKLADDDMIPKVVVHGGETYYYAPILAKGLCLSCHGAKRDIADYGVIANLYPDDLATGYKVGDLRGLWSVKFSKEKNN